MSIDALCRMPLPSLLDPDNCVLFLWRISSMQSQALRLMRAWGFGEPRSELIWHKRTVFDKRWFGMGRVFRMEHEVCLVGRRGRVPVRDHSLRSIVTTQEHESIYDLGFEAKAYAHSQKPDEQYEIIETLYDGPYCELFARRPRPGWTCLGNALQQQQHYWSDMPANHNTTR